MSNGARVAILGTRYRDFHLEEEVLAPVDARIVGGDGATSADIIAEAAGAAVIIAGSRPCFDAATIDRLECHGIVRYGVGVESVDLEAAGRAGMWVSYVPDYGTDAVATHSVALLLASIRGLGRADVSVKAGEWSFEELRPLRAPPALTVGIVGLGRIGRRVAELLTPFGFQLLAHDAFPDPEATFDIRSASLAELLQNSDIVTLHAPGRADTRPLLGRNELARLRSGSIIINTARGSLIDSEALAEGLARGRPAFAALDVFAPEPPELAFDAVADRVLLTPHMAWYTEESEQDMRLKAAREALRILQGREPLHVATPSRWPP